MKTADTDTPSNDIYRKHGISDQVLYLLMPQYSGMEISKTPQMKLLDLDNRQLKHVVVDPSLVSKAMNDLIKKQW